MSNLVIIKKLNIKIPTEKIMIMIMDMLTLGKLSNIYLRKYKDFNDICGICGIVEIKYLT